MEVIQPSCAESQAFPSCTPVQLELPSFPAKAMTKAVPRHKRVLPPVQVMLGVRDSSEFDRRDDGVDLTTLYNHDGTAFQLASDEAILACADRLLARRLHRALPILSYPKFVRRYLQAKLAREKRVTFFAFFLDRNSRLIQAAELFRGNLRSVAVHPREVLRVAYDCDAEAVFCARTDPIGDARPTSDDTAHAHRLFRMFQMAEIDFHDYFVVGKVMVSLAARGCFRQNSLLQKCS